MRYFRRFHLLLWTLAVSWLTILADDFDSTFNTSRASNDIISRGIYWSHEHYDCNMPISDVINALNPLNINAEISQFGSATCYEASYMKTVHMALHDNSTSEYERKVYEAIKSLYEDLKASVQPVLLPYDIIPHKNHNYDSDTSDMHSILVHPISFSISETLILPQIPPKRKYFSQVLPGNISTYILEERDFLHELEGSYFAFTYRKGGWDCMRHYEIIAHGTLPLFSGIRQCLPTALTNHPKKLYQLIREMPCLKVSGSMADDFRIHSYAFITEQYNPTLYRTINQALMRYARNVFTTRATAKYFLDTVHKYSLMSNESMKLSTTKGSWNKILFYMHSAHVASYLSDCLLHGLKLLLGPERVIDAEQHRQIYKDIADLDEESYLTHKKSLVKRGVSYGLLFDEDILITTNERDLLVIEDNIINHQYDLIIIASAERQHAHNIPYWDKICRYYHSKEVAVIFSSDLRMMKNGDLRTFAPHDFPSYFGCAGHIFSREGLHSL